MDDEITPEQDAMLTAIYGEDGPRMFRQIVEESKEEDPEFWGLDMNFETE